MMYSVTDSFTCPGQSIGEFSFASISLQYQEFLHIPFSDNVNIPLLLHPELLKSEDD